ncbi:MAG: TIGR00282 family metallophosphoesterase [Candidatus Omnitrophota bacterium]|nr:MAG: TIGR00282 family metallophosphoesterase [Candidatus Omnitrophota bacterium]
MLNKYKLRILFIGDIVGKPAREYLKETLSSFRKEKGVDFVIANGENASGGSSIVPRNAEELLSCGIEVITSGDHIFKKREAKKTLEEYPVIRPLNYGEYGWGKGFIIREISGVKIAVVNLLGRIFMQPVDCPFKAIRGILSYLKEQAKVIIVDMHAEATSEKLAMGYFLAKSVSAVLGTHTHIPTADERILDNFTGYITDVGMTGSFDSILGREKYSIIEKFITNIPQRFNISQEDIRMQAVLLEVDSSTGRCESIERVELRKEEVK